MGIKPIKKVNVTEQVFEQLKSMLIKGEWKQGEKIPSENELAENFGVSRITVRQALQKLGVMGLIETRLGEGSFVKAVGPGVSMNALIPAVYLGKDRMLEILEFREIIEVSSIRLAALRATEQDIEKLRQLLKSMEKNKGNSEEFGKLDLEFHMMLGEITRNDLVVKTQGILHTTLLEAMGDVVGRTGYDSGIHYHGKMIEALEQHDSELAMRIMKEHLEYNRKFYDDKEMSEDV